MALLRHNSSQVCTFRPDMSDRRWLGSIGHVTALKYSYTCPGGADQLTCNLMIEPSARTTVMDPGRIVQAVRGGGVIWEGIMNEPVPTPSGWNLTAVGAGTYGTRYDAVYTSTWPASEPDQAVNNAIGRGMRWVNPGIGSPTGIWLGQPVDSGAQDITTLLNLACTFGGLTWYVTTTSYGNILKLFPLPTAVNRLLVATTPVPRTLGGDINTVWVRYQATADATTTGSAGAVATYALTSATDQASITKYGPQEVYIDLSSAGVIPATEAQEAGIQLLARYQRASFAGPFTVGPQGLLTTGGQPIDIGADQAGTVCRLILTDFAYGGEVTPAPVSFLVGAYEYDDDAQVAVVTPFQYADTSFSGLLSAAATILPVKRW